jgi:hypothetical protein
MPLASRLPRWKLIPARDPALATSRRLPEIRLAELLEVALAQRCCALNFGRADGGVGVDRDDEQRGAYRREKGREHPEHLVGHEITPQLEPDYPQP